MFKKVEMLQYPRRDGIYFLKIQIEGHLAGSVSKVFNSMIMICLDLFLSLFIYFETESASKGGAKRGERRERENRKQVPHCQRRVSAQSLMQGWNSRNCEIMTCAEIKSQMHK